MRRRKIFTLVLEDPATLGDCDCLGPARRLQLAQQHIVVRHYNIGTCDAGL
jgi:hypothetical protein